MSETIEPLTQIRISDPVVIRRVMEEQARVGDKTATRTACRIIENYFAMIAADSRLQPDRAVQPQTA